ncbi:MAG: hypothetical protein IJI96_03515 [Methanobrevibacter sp.]|nr:hypothetical protein [Methanobrevibacter sp.]
MLNGLLKVLRWKNEKAEVKIEEKVEVEQKPKGRGKGHWKTENYTLTKDKGNRYRFNYRFNEDERLEYICKCYKSDENELVKTIENLISKGYDKKEIKAKMSNRFNKRGGKKKQNKRNSTRTGKMNEALSWDNDGILLYNDKKTNITPSILKMFCTFHSNCNSNYDLIDLINQQYKYEDLLQSAVSYICINYNSLNLQKLINEGVKIE